jgi:four helix bundle protein
MGDIRTYRDLVASQKAMALARQVYRVTEGMPKSEQFGLTLHMRRAAVSIPSNIAEGYARQSTTDYIRFLRIACGSLAEASTQIQLATDLQMIEADSELDNAISEADRVLQGLIRSLEV